MFEKKLKARGVKFFIIVSPAVPEKKQPNWYDLLLDGLTEYFNNVEIYYDPTFLLGFPLLRKK